MKKKPIQKIQGKPIRKAQGKHFYSHLVETSHLSLELGDLDLMQEERIELISLADSQMHHVIIDTILSELSKEDKKIFLSHLHNDDHDSIWNLLNQKAVGIEEKIKKAVDDLKSELHRDIKDAKK